MILPFEPGVAGIDEAGRGPIAGPVVVAAVILPIGFDAEGVVDSKKLSRARRTLIRERILAEAEYQIEVVSHETIDRKNILRATLDGMAAVASRLAGYTEAIIDGNQVPPGLSRCRAIVDGDALRAEIAAASILAKEHRDDLMRNYALQFPEYGFDRHFGYCVEEHLLALQTYGPCPIHRTTFSPVQEMLLQPTFDF